MSHIVYEGFFIVGGADNVMLKDLRNAVYDKFGTSALDIDIAIKHITTEFKPPILHENLYGSKAEFVITGYGNDGHNEAFSVRLKRCDDVYLIKTFDSLENPHITLSVDRNGLPKNSKNLLFKELSPVYESYGDPVIIKTMFGGYLSDDINGRMPIFGLQRRF